MRRPRLEVADVFHRHGAAWRKANAGHVSLGQLKVMSAIESCRSAALGGHVECCEDCGHSRIAYNSCRNRHCPKCQGAAAKDWLAAREADLLPVGYFHVVFTLPAEIAPIAYQNKSVVYDLLFRTAAETLLTIAADPRHLGARIGATAVLHSWGSAMTHHPHLHMIVPGGGISLDGKHWVHCRPGFLLPVRVLSRLFRRLFLTRLADAHAAGRLAFFGELDGLRSRAAFAAYLAPLRKKNWFVYGKPPFAGPEAVLAYLARYTHRVAISNSRLIGLDDRGVNDPDLVEGLLDHHIGLAADDKLLARHGHHLCSDHHRVIAELVDPLHLQGLDDIWPEFRVLLQLKPNLLDPAFAPFRGRCQVTPIATLLGALAVRRTVRVDRR